MRLEQSFEVNAPIEQVWTALIDLEKVAPCLPGAAITGHDDDGTYHGTFQVKLGPTTANYRGTIKIQSADAATRTATLAARGSDKRGQGGASATIVNSLHEVDGGHARRRRDRLHDHRAARVLRPWRDDQGHLQPPAARLRRLPPAAPRHRARRRDDARRGGRERRRGGETAGKTPAEVSGKSPAEVSGKSPAELAESAPPPAATQTGPAQPPAAAPPVKGFSLLASVLWERVRNLFRRR